MKVSMVIPCFNAAPWIKQCVLSALNQTYPNTEVIFVDNQSTDNSVAIVEEIQQQYPQLIMDSAPNLYKHSWDECRDRAWEIMTGDWLGTIASDDYIGPRYIETYVRYLEQNKEILAVQSPIRSVRNGVVAEDISYFYKDIEQFKKMCLLCCPANSPTILYSKKLYDEGSFKTHPELYSGAADYFFYCELADKGVMIHPMREWAGYFYRWHDKQCTWGMQGTNYDRQIQNYWREKWTED